MSMSSNDGERLQALRPGLMYLWTALTRDQSISGLQVILSTDEQKQARRFRRAKDWHQFVIAHALVRLALSRHFPVPASGWHFDRDRNGKPFIAAPEMSPAVQFSISHTEGLVACLITLSAEAAVDVEKVEYTSDLAMVAHQIFSPTELRALRVLSGKDWTARFFDYWTLKEAYAKAQGLGLVFALGDIGFELGPENRISANYASPVDDPLAWIFWRDHPQSQHAISLAVKRDFDDECEIIHRSVKFDGARIIPEAQARRIELSKQQTTQSPRRINHDEPLRR
jgi:4'-phosphopantetheinyl transferase